MDQGINLSTILLKLSRKILHAEVKSKHDALTKLLQRIDGDFFKNLNSLVEGDYESISNMIINFYSQELKERIKKIFLIKAAYTQKFIHIFQLVIDLAFHTHQNEKQNYLQQIVKLDDHQKQILMPYFEQVMDRKFIQKVADVNEDLFDIKEQQYQELIDTHEKLEQKYYQLLENYTSLKAISQKAQTDCQNFYQQKYEFMSDIGMSSAAGFLQVAEKLKKDMKDYEHEFERLNKELEDRNKIIVTKEQQIKQLSSSAHNVEGYQKQLSEHIKRNNELNDLLLSTQKKQLQLKDNIQALERSVQKLNRDLQDKNDCIRKLQQKREKYNEVKQLHLQFKKNLVKKYIHH